TGGAVGRTRRWSAAASCSPASGSGMARLTAEVGIRTRRILYGEPSPAELVGELGQLTIIDQAHLLMLTERDLIPRSAARTLLACIAELRSSGFAPLAGRPAPRGLYLMYEGYLISR